MTAWFWYCKELLTVSILRRRAPQMIVVSLMLFGVPLFAALCRRCPLILEA
jgi:hypothetical protein